MQRTKPTAKQKAFVKAYIKRKFNASAAASDVYDVKKDQSANLGHQVLNKPIVQQTIKEELTKAGISLDYVNDTMKEAMELNKAGKPSQAVLAQLIIHAHKLYNAVPDRVKVTIKQERKELLSKSYDELKEELVSTITTSQAILQDL